LVPNVEEFCSVLKIIKHWAKSTFLNLFHNIHDLLFEIERGIYSTKFGYLGGASWTILVASICQRFPHLSEENLILEFFKTFSRWDWAMPVALEGAHAKKFTTVLI
jgi:poly(A) polymerase Pap1